MKFKYITKRRLVAFVLSTIVLGSTISLGGCKNKEEDIAIYQQIIDENGEESNILEYLEVSEDLHKMDLDKYEFDKNDNMILDTPDNIKKGIKKYNNNKTNVTNIDYLKNQEVLVNKHIYDEGYDVAHDAIEKSTKSYAAMLYDLNPSSIELTYSFNKNDGSDIVRLEYKQGYQTKTILVDDENIKNGVISTHRTLTKNDKDMSDNDEYNEDRNRYIKDAIVKSYKLDNISGDYYYENSTQKTRK